VRHRFGPSADADIARTAAAVISSSVVIPSECLQRPCITTRCRRMTSRGRSSHVPARTEHTTRRAESYQYLRWWSAFLVEPVLLVGFIMNEKDAAWIRERAERGT
jgi:hypothetical protein